jgi:hypothetical protein
MVKNFAKYLFEICQRKVWQNENDFVILYRHLITTNGPDFINFKIYPHG